jgi:hypothetical protein
MFHHKFLLGRFIFGQKQHLIAGHFGGILRHINRAIAIEPLVIALIPLERL